MKKSGLPEQRGKEWFKERGQFRHDFCPFLTKDQSRLRVVKDDDSLGLTADGESLTSMRKWLRASKPAG